jgi:bleomycin hydrolase
LRYQQLVMSHAMVFTEYEADQDGRIVSFRVENSWGPTVNKGYFLMTDAWFDDFVIECCVPPSAVSAELVQLWHKDKPIMLPVWDPLGMLA